jgi:YaiO family outer membrane protein
METSHIFCSSLRMTVIGFMALLVACCMFSKAEAENLRLKRAIEDARSSGAVEIGPQSTEAVKTEPSAPAAPEVTPPENAVNDTVKPDTVVIEEKTARTTPEVQVVPPERRNRIEVSTSYDYLHPHEDFGDWKNITTTFFRKERPDLTWFVQLGAYSRKEGNGLLTAAGAYKDWTERIFTYTAVSAGTNSEYLPQVRIDHDFNFKFGREKNFVWVVGGSYIQYFNVHRDYIISTGLTVYEGKWLAGYRIFRNLSDPGSVVSYSHLFTLGYGQDGWQWTTATFSFGKQAYLATALAEPEAVDHNSIQATMNHRRWLGKDYGVFGEVSFFHLNDSYQKTGFTIGVFKEL